jgi:putative transposase
MKAKRFSEEQIIGVLKEAEAGAKTKELCRRHGISEATFYNWKAKYAGMAVSEARRLKELEHENAKLKRYGYRRVYLRLRREGWEVNRKRVYRLYREAGLAVRRRRRKRLGPYERKPLPKPMAANVSWSMDFVADVLIGGRRLRCLTIVDDCTRECLAIEVDTSITGLRVQAVLDRLADTRGLPKSITVDNGPSSTARCSTSGRIAPASASRLFDPASRTRTRTSKASTASSATNA